MSIQPATYPHSGRRIDRRAAAYRDEGLLLGLLGIALTIRAFIPTDLLDLFVHYSTLGGSIFEKIHPGAYLLLALGGLVFFTQDTSTNLRDRSVKNGSYALLVAMGAAIVVGLLTGRTAGVSYILDSLILGPIVGLIMLRMSPRGQSKILVYILTLLIINDFLLFFEFATHFRLMPYRLHEPYFRPTGFLGHPLLNGLVNATAIAFVWVTPWSNARKLALSIFFMAACFAAGARMATIASVLATVMCTWVELGQSARKGRIDEGAFITIAIAAMAFVLIVITIVVLSGLAERLIGFGLFNDQSSQSRFQIYQIFNYMSFTQLMFGISHEWANYMITNILNLPGSESPIVDFVIQFGIIGTVMLVAGMLIYFWCYATAPRNAFAIVGTMIFVATASTNNTFSGKGSDMAIFAALLVGSFSAPASQHFRAQFRRPKVRAAQRPAIATS